MESLYTNINVGVKPKQISKEQESRLKQVFDYNKLTSGNIHISKIQKCVDDAKIGQTKKEAKRMQKLAKITSKDGETIGYSELFTLVQNKIDVNMLHKLFHDANTDVEYERVEFFLDVDEMMALLKKLDVEMTRSVFEKELVKLDKDSDGRVDWEEFLTVASNILGAYVSVNSADSDGTDFNQLRDSTNRMKTNLINTNVIIKELDNQIQEKKKEIEKRIKDTTLEDIRKKLKKEWDDKDRMEMALLDLKIKHFNEMKDALLANDQDKAALVDRFKEAVRQRDHVRSQIDRVREKFKERFSNNFLAVKEIMSVLSEIDSTAKKVHEGLALAKAASDEARQVWKATSQYEQPPVVSTNDTALEYLNKQNTVMSEITTKMQMMQRERDKYEDMIEEEVSKNKAKRIECVNLNMQITNMETQLMALEAKHKDMHIQNTTLQVELEKKLKDKDSKKVKELKNTVFQFECERDEVVAQVEETKMKLKRTDNFLLAAKKKAAQLNIELGELKILLEGMKNISINDTSSMTNGE
eukprot:g4211.t1